MIDLARRLFHDYNYNLSLSKPSLALKMFQLKIFSKEELDNVFDSEK